ncbi:dehydrogenase [Arthrobacter sp. Hiyo8]|nr:dehydrogenase [Arthrobacter sp. Hiyo8]
MTLPRNAPQNTDTQNTHPQTALAYWTVGPCQGELRSEDLPAPAQGEAVVRALYSGISRGTELVVHEAHVPTRTAKAMRAPHQTGTFPRRSSSVIYRSE